MGRANRKQQGDCEPRAIGEPTRQRRAHAAEIVEFPSDTAGRPARKVLDPLDHLFARRGITERQYSAGQRIREDHELGVLGARDPEKMGTGSVGYGPVQAQIDAATRYRKAMRCLCASMALVIDRIVCQAELVTVLARRYRWNPHRVVGRLESALDMLADHYAI